MDDSLIVELFERRDQQAAAEAQQKYSAYCRSVAAHILCDQRDVEEAVNETWLGAWNSIPPAKPKSLPAFLGGITRNISLNLLRAENTSKRKCGISEQYDELAEMISSGSSVEDEIGTKELASAIERFLGELPEEQRRMFVCRYWYFDPVDDIAGRFGYSRGKVKSTLFRLRKKLRDRLQKEELL